MPETDTQFVLREQLSDKWDELYFLAMNGNRIYYSMPTITCDPYSCKNTCLVFKIRQRINFGAIEEIRRLDRMIKKETYQPPLHNSNYMDKLCKDIAANTYKNKNTRIRQSIAHKWPASPFEEWMNKEHKSHWMTAKWFRGENAGPYDDFAILISVYVPVIGSIEKFEDRYGEAFVMTKLVT